MEMKSKWFLSLASLAVMLPGCNKEMENPQAEAPVEKVRMTLTASLDEETRTAYEGEKTFSWTAGDKIAVRMMDGKGNCGWIGFSTEESGPSVTFSADVPADFHPTGFAYYSLVSIERDADEYAADLDGVSYGLMYYYYPQIDNMDRLNLVPLIGTLKEGSESDFSFRTASGIVKIPLENVPSELDAVRLESESASLCGAFPITEKGYFAMEDVLEGYALGDLAIYPIVENGQTVVYFPLPVGTLPAGAKLSFLDKYENELAFKTTVKDVEITRNKIIQFPAMDVGAMVAENPWENLGYARMFDSMFQFSATHFCSVPIQRLKSDPHVYRLVNPYGIMLGEPDAWPYLTFQVHEAGEALISDGSVVSSHYGIVTFEPHDTGYAYPYQDAAGADQYGNIWLRCVNLYTGVSEEDFQYSIVIRQDAEGNPTHIQLAPIYYYGGGTFWRYYYNDMIQIAMPGYDPIDIAFWMNFSWSYEGVNKADDIIISYDTHEGIDEFLFALSDISTEDAYARLDTDDAIYVGPDHVREGQLKPQFPAEHGVFYVAVRGYHYGYVMNSFAFQISVASETASDEYLFWLGSWQADNGETWTVSAGANDVDYMVSGLFGLDNYSVRATFNAQTGSLVFSEQDENLFYGLYISTSNNQLYYYGKSAIIFSVDPDCTVIPGYLSDSQTAFIQYYLHNADYDYPQSDIPSSLTRVSQQPSAVPAVHSAHSSSPNLDQKTMSRRLVPIR